MGLRRLRVALRAFRPLLRRKPARRLELELRRVMRLLGPARDWDVFCATHRPLTPAVRRARAKADSAAREGLGALPEVIDEVLVWTQSDPWRSTADAGEPLVKFAARVLVRMDHALRKAVTAAAWSDARARHRVRNRAKRLRYAGDFFGAVATRRLRKRVAAAAALQSVLGKLNDLDVQAKLRRSIEARPARAETARGSARTPSRDR